MKIDIIIFGQLAEMIGATQLQFENIEDSDALKSKLQKDYPALSKIQYLIAVDKKTISENTTLMSNSVIALLPPFSGG